MLVFRRAVRDSISHFTVHKWDMSQVALLGKKSKNVFRFFEFRLGINFFHFRLGCFEEVGERLGSPGAGVEIGTG